MGAFCVSFYDRLARFGLPPDDLSFFERTLATSSSVVDARTSIVAEQSDDDRIFVLFEGWACKFRTLSGGRRQLGPIHLAGDFCNLDALVEGRGNFGVLALTGCLVASVPRDTLLLCMDHRPALRQLLLSVLVGENKTMINHVVNLGRRSARERTANLLVDLLARLHENGEALDGRIRCALTQSDMADYLGLSTVHTNRALKDLKESGYISGKGNLYTIADRPGLQALASF